MSDLIFNPWNLAVGAVFFCVVVGMLVWLRVKPDQTPDEEDSRLRNQRTAALFARVGNWAIAAVNVVIGVWLGVAVHGLAQLMFRGAWVAVFIVAVLAAALLLIVLLHDRLGKRLFPDGIRRARKPEVPVRTPLVRRLGLPAGLVLGVVLAGLGWDGWLLGWISLVP
jgi:cytochrome bd-type quinol oxidase subunit 2